MNRKSTEPCPRRTPVPAPRWAPDGRIYVVGGGDALGNYLTTVEAYIVGTNTWTTVAGLTVGSGGLGVVTGPDGRIYAVGGYNPGMSYLATVEAYTVGPPTRGCAWPG